MKGKKEFNRYAVLHKELIRYAVLHNACFMKKKPYSHSPLPLYNWLPFCGVFYRRSRYIWQRLLHHNIRPFLNQIVSQVTERYNNNYNTIKPNNVFLILNFSVLIIISIFQGEQFCFSRFPCFCGTWYSAQSFHNKID